MPNWNCWLGDESGGNRVNFEKGEQPSEIPFPKRSRSGSTIKLIAPGAKVIQGRGYDLGVISVRLNVTYEKYLSIVTLITRVIDGQHMSVQFNNSYSTYLCKSVGEIDPTMRNKLPVKVSINLELEVLSIV
jgi:hypothetical protein